MGVGAVEGEGGGGDVVVYEESQLNRDFGFQSFMCSSIPKAIFVEFL